MKLRTVLISVVVTGALVAGGGYGAYYAMQSRQKPVEVVPVSNVSQGYYGWEQQEIVYGTITSQVSQTVQLNEEYPLEEVFVAEGDKVKEGTPLFSYDMTLQELELEMEELNLQTSKLNMTRLEKELDKLKKTPASASLVRDFLTLTASADEPVIDEGQDDASGSGQTPVGETGSQTETPDSGQTGSGVEIEDVEISDLVPEGSDEADEQAIKSSVESYERLLMAIDVLFEEYAEQIRSDDIGEAVLEAAAYYRKNLADEKVTEETQEDGSARKIREYVLKDSVKKALSADEAETLAGFCKKAEKYQLIYLELAAKEAGDLSGEERTALIGQARGLYQLLSTGQQEKAHEIEAFREIEDLVAKNPEEPGTESESEPEETESEQETETGTETESEPGTETETETGTEQESEPITESEPRVQYLLTIRYPAVVTEKHYAGDTVSLQADTGDVTVTFAGWQLEPVPEGLTEEDLRSPWVTFAMPESDMTATARYQNVPAEIETYIQNFEMMAAELLAENAEQTFGSQGRDYATELEGAVLFYQQWLAAVPDEIVGETPEMKMEDYHLKENVKEYLQSQGKETAAAQIEEEYKELCLRYVRALFRKIDINAVDRELLEKTQRAYDLLGDTWTAELEARWQSSQPGQTPETDEEGNPLEPPAVLSIGDMLQAYEVICDFHEYREQKGEMSEEERYLALQGIWNDLMWLTDAQREFVTENCPKLVKALKKYGLWEEEPETEPYFPDYWDGGDWDDPMYTASELQEMINEVEQEMKSCELEIRQDELNVKQKQRIVDGKVVKSTMEGTVIRVGGADDDEDGDYFIKVANEEGLYARGAMNELSLEKLKVGASISGMSTMNGTQFTAVIKEVSEYPEADGYSGSYGMENTNASYYPFYALIDDPEGLEEGDAQIFLSGSVDAAEDAIYLENFFIRTESDGRSYVFKEGDDGLLTKQYVTTGKNMYGYATEIVSGLTQEDKIAFPYGKSVKEGARTKEVDALNY